MTQHIVHESHRDWLLRTNRRHNNNVILGGIMTAIAGFVIIPATIGYGFLILTFGIGLIYFSYKSNNRISGEQSQRLNAPLSQMSYG